MGDFDIVSRFFESREHVIQAGGAEEFYRHLENEIGDLPKYEHSPLGDRVKDPDNPDRLLRLSEEKVLFFRGQSDSRWGLNSSLYRRVDSTVTSRASFQTREKRLLKVEKMVLEKARLKGVVRGLTGLELLTVLQHHGVATRLLDVTTDWKVALYFACDDIDSRDRDGRLFFISLAPASWKDFPRKVVSDEVESRSQGLVWWDYESVFPIDDSVLNGLEGVSPWFTSVWPVLLPFTDARMIAQRGYFLVGGINQVPEPYVLNRDEGESLQDISVNDCRKISSLAIDFPWDPRSQRESLRSRLKGLVDYFSPSYSCSAVTVRIPALFKEDLLRLLNAEGVDEMQIYPPVADKEVLDSLQCVVNDGLGS